MFKGEFCTLEHPVFFFFSLTKMTQFILDSVPFENLMKICTIYNTCTYTMFAYNFSVVHEPLRSIRGYPDKMPFMSNTRWWLIIVKAFTNVPGGLWAVGGVF